MTKNQAQEIAGAWLDRWWPTALAPVKVFDSLTDELLAAYDTGYQEVSKRVKNALY